MSNDRPFPSAEAIEDAAARLDAGELVAFPTETVYGLGADAQNPAAVARIYAAKGRPANHPVIVHLAPGSDPGYWVEALPADAKKLIDAFWPGPLTLILKRATHIPDAVSGGQDSVGLRCPSHPVAQALLRAFDARRGGHGGVAAPSANRFGHVSPTTAQHVRDEFGDAVHVLDGGPSDVGIESTILDLSRGFPALLRPGHVSPRQIADVLGVAPRLPDGSDATAPRASGTLKAHYAPRTPLALARACSATRANRWPRVARRRVGACGGRAFRRGARGSGGVRARALRVAARARSCAGRAHSRREAARYGRMDGGKRPARPRGGGVRRAGVSAGRAGR